MKRPKKRVKRPIQIEFDVLVQQAIDASANIPKKDLHSKQPHPHSIRSLTQNSSPPTPATSTAWTPWEGWDQIAEQWHPFDDDWSESSRTQVVEASSLRSALTLSATHLSDLLDFEFERSQLDEKWIGEYATYCSEKHSEFESQKSKDTALAALAWAVAEFIFEAYQEAPNLDDWALFESCSIWVDDEDLSPQTYEQKVDAICTVFAGCILCLHQWIICQELPTADS